jgi:hypothetical protein
MVTECVHDDLVLPILVLATGAFWKERYYRTYIDTPEPDDKPKNELKEKRKSAKRHSVDKKDDPFAAEEASDSDKTKLIQKLNDKMNYNKHYRPVIVTRYATWTT